MGPENVHQIPQAEPPSCPHGCQGCRVCPQGHQGPQARLRELEPGDHPGGLQVPEGDPVPVADHQELPHHVQADGDLGHGVQVDVLLRGSRQGVDDPHQARVTRADVDCVLLPEPDEELQVIYPVMRR